MDAKQPAKAFLKAGAQVDRVLEMHARAEDHRIAVLIPCYNEAVTVQKVVSDFHKALPSAVVYVYDNNSTDQTATLAAQAGADVRFERRQGKGFVVQSMFLEIDADAYLMVDGDDTYPADQAANLLQPILNAEADMVVGTRLKNFKDQSFRPLHVFGNQLVVQTINFSFNSRLQDVMSGYRAFSRRFIQQVPIVARGFEIETELTLQALFRNMVIREVPILYGERPKGSFSKLNTFRDGARVLLKIVDILKAYRPLLFFSMVGMLVGLLGLVLGAIPAVEFLRTGRVDRFPTAILAAALEIVAIVVVACGIVLDSVNRHFRELAQLVIKTSSDNSTARESQKP